MVNRNVMRVQLSDPETKDKAKITNGGLDINSENDFFLDMAKGEIEGHSYVFKFGYSDNVTTTEAPLWDVGGPYTLIEDEQFINIVSDSADDDLLGTGARTVLISGIDKTTHEAISEVIEMDGTTPVQSLLKYHRLNRAIVLTSGTNSITADANYGTIDFTTDVGAIQQAQIKPGEGQTLMCIYTIPAGFTGYLSKTSFSVGKGREVDFKLRVRNLSSEANGAFSTKYKIPMYEGALTPELKVPLAIPTETDVAITAKSALGTVPAGASFGIILVENE